MDTVKLLYILDYGNSLYGGTNFASAAWRQDFTNFAAAAAARYKGDGVVWELWNEPNGTGGPTADQYMALANQVVPAIRNADTNSTIIGPATSTIDTSYLTSCFSYGLLSAKKVCSTWWTRSAYTLIQALRVRPPRRRWYPNTGPVRRDLSN